MRKLKLAAAAAAAVLCISCFAAVAAAEENEMSITAESVLVTDNIDLPDSEELFEGYVEKTFYGDYGDSTYSLNLGERLTGNDKKVYDILKAEIKKIADGINKDTKISIAATDIFGKDTITKGEVGCDDLTTEDGMKALLAYVSINYTKVLEVLRADCCYELYWYDKTSTGGVSYTNGWNMSYNSETAQLTSPQVFSFCVSADYSESKTTKTYVTDTTKTAAAKTAAANAQTVVNDNVTKTDIEKLLAYKQYICDSVSYNREAADNSSTPYGNPWQLIYVFDEKSDTNVVCEGYAKAFQYLCDLSTFSNPKIYCISVTGTMNGGGHMWNVMRMDDGKNYLVDVTNSDTGTIGSGGNRLFLNTYDTKSSDTSYTYTIISQSVTFVYDTNTTAIYSSEELVLSNDKYHWDYNGDGRCDEVGCGKIIDDFGATLAGYTISLSGNIGVNFYMELSDTILNDNGAYMQFTLPNRTTKTVKVADVKDSAKDANGKKFYIFPCEVAAKEMTDEITAQMFDGSGKGGAIYTYTVKEYADYIIKHPTEFANSEKTVALVKAMLNYGAASQLYFKHNPGNLANEDLTSAEKTLTEIISATLSTYVSSYTMNTKYTGSTAYYGSSLVLKSGTDIKHYFTHDTSIGIDKYTCTDSGGNSYDVAVSGSYIYIRVPNIPAHKLGEALTLTLYENGTPVGTISNYSPMSYAYAVLTAYPTAGSEKDTLRNVVIALYHYYTKATAA